MSTPLTGRMIAAARTPANDHAAARLAALGRAASHRDLPAPSEPVQRHRGGHGFVRESNHCRPLNRNDRARLMQLAESLERRTKPSGKRNGSLGYTGIRVLKALMALFANARSGLCCPSYTALQAATGLSRQAIADALHRLETTKLLTITRRLVRARIVRRSPITGAVESFISVVQGSNLYAFNVPAPGALIPLPWRPTRRKLDLVTRPESTTTTGNQTQGSGERKKGFAEPAIAAALDRMARLMGFPAVELT